MLRPHPISVGLLAVLLALPAGCGREAQQTPAPPPSQQQGQAPASPPSTPEVKEPPVTPPPEKPAELEPAKPKEIAKPGKPLIPAAPHAALLNPALATAKAPEQFKVKFETTKGDVVLQVNRSWAPRGADRFYNLVRIGYYNDAAFFRVIDGFMAQFGIHGDPKVNEKWDPASISDDPVKESNLRGAISFATAGPDTRTTQLFINYGDNRQLDQAGFAPFAKVVQGMEVVDAFYKDYGEGAPRGGGPSQGLLQSQGNSYLRTQFPKLDYIKRASVVK
jgi:peptidyl-prolyl cis-trans isomerase A (cyclophilin A)